MNSKNKNTKYIGIAAARLNDEIHSELIHSIISKACGYGYKVLIFSAFTDFYAMDRYDIGESYVFDLIDYNKLDALIIFSESIHDERVLGSVIRRALDHNVFTVSVDKRAEGCCYAGFDHKKAFETIVRHVVETHKCRKINLVAGFKGNPFSEERVECWRRVMRENGMEPDERRIMYGDFWSGPTKKAFDEFMASGMEMPEAFICCNDNMAISICGKLKEYGYSVPRDVIVTGLDGIPEEQYHLPRLTTAKQDTALAGERIMENIRKYFLGEPYEDSIIIEHRIMISHSCGCREMDYSDTSAQSPMLEKEADDNIFDNLMFDLENACSSVDTVSELSDVVYRYTADYGKHYFAVSLKDDFMDFSDGYEELVGGSQRHRGPRLVLCERVPGKDYPPVYNNFPQHFEEAALSLNVFLFWSVHFQDVRVGLGIMGLSTGCDGFEKNDDFIHLLQYTRNLNHVLEITNSQAVMKKVINRLRELYVHDHTGLLNRRGFYSEINKSVTAAREDRENIYYLVIISFDMDGLKFINDTYGHAEGDVAIKAAADALIAIWGNTEICSRFGGDEFTVASVCRSDPEERGNSIAERIKKLLEGFNASSGKPYKVSGSFGINYGEINDKLSIDELIREADDLMYRDKQTHRESRSRGIRRD